MKGFKIHYGEYKHDHYGKPEWCGWYEYNNVIYTDKKKCEEMIEDVKEQFPDREFEIYEVCIE